MNEVARRASGSRDAEQDTVSRDADVQPVGGARPEDVRSEQSFAILGRQRAVLEAEAGVADALQGTRRPGRPRRRPPSRARAAGCRAVPSSVECPAVPRCTRGRPPADQASPPRRWSVARRARAGIARCHDCRRVTRRRAPTPSHRIPNPTRRSPGTGGDRRAPSAAPGCCATRPRLPGRPRDPASGKMCPATLAFVPVTGPWSAPPAVERRG